MRKRRPSARIVPLPSGRRLVLRPGHTRPRTVLSENVLKKHEADLSPAEGAQLDRLLSLLLKVEQVAIHGLGARTAMLQLLRGFRDLSPAEQALFFEGVEVLVMDSDPS